ncbi:MAG: hypothetical protein U0R19_36375 [Bryobacteraceae bacterium]
MRAAFIFTILSALAAPASASLITVSFTGTITQVPVDDIFGDIAPGDVFQGAYTYDSTALDQIPGATTGSYSFTAPLGLTATIGQHLFDATGDLNIGIFNSFLDQYTVFAQNTTGLTIGLTLQDNSATAILTDELPTTAPVLAGFTQAAFQLSLTLDGAELQADGQLDGLTSVPEPSSLPLVLAAFLAFCIPPRRP